MLIEYINEKLQELMQTYINDIQLNDNECLLN